MNYLNFTPTEWAVLSNAVDSLKIVDIAEKSGLPYNTVQNVIKRLRNKIRIGFVPDYWKMVLVPIAAIFQGKMRIKNVPFYTTTVRKLYGTRTYTLVTGIVPEKYLDDYFSEFPYDPIVEIKALETKYWTPKARLTVFLLKLNIVAPKFGDSEIFKLAVEKTRLEKPSRVKLDKIDVIIVVWKIKYAFIKLAEIARKYHDTYRLNKQLLSYHFKKHVIPLWRQNYIRAYLGLNSVPFRIYLFTGPDAATLAKILVELLHFSTAYIGEDIAAVTAQTPCHMHVDIHKLFSMFDVEIPLGDLIIDPTNLVVNPVDLIKLFHRNDWIYPVKAERREKWKIQQ